MTATLAYKVIVAGSRDFDDYEMLAQTCDKLLESKIGDGVAITIVSGTARGADTLGERYAKERGFAVERYPAQWETHGKAAGHKRNALMATVANALIAFWDGKSRGTANMIEVAKRAGLAVKVARIGGRRIMTATIDTADPFLRLILDDYRWDTIPILADWLEERGECSRARQLRGRYRKFMVTHGDARKNWRSPFDVPRWRWKVYGDHDSARSCTAVETMSILANRLRDWIKQEFKEFVISELAAKLARLRKDVAIVDD